MAGLTAGYAAALYERASEHGVLDECLEQAASVWNALRAGKARGTIENPRLSGAEKRTFLDSVLPKNLHNDIIGFLHLLLADHREELIVPALTAFLYRGEHRDEKALAHIFSAMELKQEQASALEHTLSLKLNKKVELSLDTDPSLIGGLCIHVDGYVIDRTVKKQLADLRDAIKRGGAV